MYSALTQGCVLASKSVHIYSIYVRIGKHIYTAYYIYRQAYIYSIYIKTSILYIQHILYIDKHIYIQYIYIYIYIDKHIYTAYTSQPQLPSMHGLSFADSCWHMHGFFLLRHPLLCLLMADRDRYV